MTILPIPTPRSVALYIITAAGVAGVILALFVLPAEFHRDPTGFGKWSGILALSASTPEASPAEIPASSDSPSPARSSQQAFRSDTIKIPLEPDAQLEYKVRAKEGSAFVYGWSIDKGEVYYDFHGEPTGDPEHSRSYETGTTRAANGSLIVPMEGIHGWFFLNQEGHPIAITLKLSGFYELIPLTP